VLSQYVPEHHYGRTPLQFSATNLAYSLALEQTKMLQSWERMILCIIESGADLHEVVHSYTPLSLFLKNFLGNGSEEKTGLRPRDLQRMLKVWLNILQRADVDLVAYGTEESRRLRAPRFLEEPLPQLPHWYALYWGSSDEVFYLTFSYGPTPQDWTVQLDMAEQYAGDFWRMPGLLSETEVQVIPGSWIDT
jgi:hypothetical protein